MAFAGRWTTFTHHDDAPPVFRLEITALGPSGCCQFSGAPKRGTSLRRDPGAAKRLLSLHEFRYLSSGHIGYDCGEGSDTDHSASMSFTVPTVRSRTHRWPAEYCGPRGRTRGAAEDQNVV
jgi:hypothetical protein